MAIWLVLPVFEFSLSFLAPPFRFHISDHSIFLSDTWPGLVCSTYQLAPQLSKRAKTLRPDKHWEQRDRSVQFSHSVVSDSLQLHGLQHAKLSCPSLTPRDYSNSCSLSQWCHPTISSSVIPFSHLQSFPASGSFPAWRILRITLLVFEMNPIVW